MSLRQRSKHCDAQTFRSLGHKFDASVMGTDEQSLDWALMPERRRRGIFVEHGMIKFERRRCDINPEWIELIQPRGWPIP